MNSLKIRSIKKCTGIRKLFGLMFKSRNTNALVFEFNKSIKTPIHSLFCPSFLAVWMDNNKIIDSKIIKPWKINIKPDKPFTKLIEIPINKKYSRIINSFTTE